MQKVSFQPKRLNTVNPYLMLNNVDEFIEFTQKIFTAKLENKLHRPNGKIMHAEIRIGDSIIMAGEPMGDFNAFPGSLYVYVEDCDTVYKKAMDYGCTSIMEPITMKHAGERYGGAKDKNNNIWWIATHIEDVSPEEQMQRIEEMKENWEE